MPIDRTRAPRIDPAVVRRSARVAAALASLLLAACASRAAHEAHESDAVASAGQLVVVTSPGWDDTHGTLRRFEREGDRWREVGAATPVMLGRSGSAWGVGVHPPPPDAVAGPRKREGDGRSPAGVFALGTAFGYADTVASGLPYQAMTRDDWCMDVPASPHYNRIVDARQVGAAAVAGSSEPMRLDLHRNGNPSYRLGFVIEHNPGNVPQGGSCIFAHLWRAPGEPTAGCTAMADADMEAMLEWLDADKTPRFVLLPRAQYARLATRWQLPALAPTEPER